MKTMILKINGNVYQMGDKQVESVFSAARYALKGKLAIYALVKGNVIECRKDLFPNKKALNKAVKEYKSRGFKVFHT